MVSRLEHGELLIEREHLSVRNRLASSQSVMIEINQVFENFLVPHGIQ